MRRYFEEVCNARDLDVADEIAAADFTGHIPQSPPASGPEGVKAAVAVYQDALDGRWDIQEMFSTGDRVVTRWIGRGTHNGELGGIPATGRTSRWRRCQSTAWSTARSSNWTVWDALGLMQQIGAVPATA